MDTCIKHPSSVSRPVTPSVDLLLRVGTFGKSHTARLQVVWISSLTFRTRSWRATPVAKTVEESLHSGPKFRVWNRSKSALVSLPSCPPPHPIHARDAAALPARRRHRVASHADIPSTGRLPPRRENDRLSPHLHRGKSRKQVPVASHGARKKKTAHARSGRESCV